jgi:hypothetical protein
MAGRKGLTYDLDTLKRARTDEHNELLVHDGIAWAAFWAARADEGIGFGMEGSPRRPQQTLAKRHEHIAAARAILDGFQRYVDQHPDALATPLRPIPPDPSHKDDHVLFEDPAGRLRRNIMVQWAFYAALHRDGDKEIIMRTVDWPYIAVVRRGTVVATFRIPQLNLMA